LKSSVNPSPSPETTNEQDLQSEIKHVKDIPGQTGHIYPSAPNYPDEDLQGAVSGTPVTDAGYYDAETQNSVFDLLTQKLGEILDVETHDQDVVKHAIQPDETDY